VTARSELRQSAAKRSQLGRSDDHPRGMVRHDRDVKADSGSADVERARKAENSGAPQPSGLNGFERHAISTITHGQSPRNLSAQRSVPALPSSGRSDVQHLWRSSLPQASSTTLAIPQSLTRQLSVPTTRVKFGAVPPTAGPPPRR
jgi:hypothetical protein